jgi:hypothetical protein
LSQRDKAGGFLTMGFEKNFQYGWEVGKMGSWEVMKLLIDNNLSSLLPEIFHHDFPGSKLLPI